MLNHEDIIKKMTVNQKLQIITDFLNISNKKTPDEYNFFEQKVSLNKLYYNGSVLPDIGSISASFNDDLMYKYSSFLGYTAYKKNYKFVLTPSLNVFNAKNLISKEPLLNTVVLACFIRGLSDNSVIPLLNYFDDSNNIKDDDFIHLNEYLQSVLSLKTISYPFIFFDNSSKNKNNIITDYIINNDYKRLFINNVPCDKQPRKTVSLTNANVAGVDTSKYDIDLLLDELLDYLLLNNHIENDYDYSKLLNELMVESTCLLKNNDVLPLKGEHKICIVSTGNISEIDFNDFNRQFEIKKQEGIPIISKDEFDTLIVIIENEEELLNVKKESHKLKTIHENGVKIIAVLTFNDVVNTSFDKDVDVLIKTVIINKTNVKSFMDILIGEKCPCGKLNISYPIDSYDYNGNELLTEVNTKYPFGFSLNYGELTYSDFNVDYNKITLLVSNESHACASDVIQVYMENQRWLGEKHLIYYKKIYLKPGESQRISIILTRDNFSRYNKNSNTYRLKKGLYRLYVNNSLTNCLKDYLLIFDIDKSTLVGKSFKNNALVALEPRYTGKLVDYKYKRIVIYALLALGIIFLIAALVKPNIFLYILAAASFIGIIPAKIIKIKPVSTITNDLDKHFTPQDVIQFEEYYKENMDTNDYLYDKSDIFKETRTKKIVTPQEQNFYYIKNLDDFLEFNSDMYSYFKSNGYFVEKKYFDKLIAAIYTSRVNYVKSNNIESLRSGVKLLNKFLNNIDFDCYNLKETIETAKNNPHCLFVVYLDKVNKNIVNINNDCKFSTMTFNIEIDNEKIELCKNIWYIIPYTELLLDNFDFNASLTICDFLETEKIEYNKELRPVYFDTLYHFLRTLSDEYAIDEIYYKKFDDLIQYFKGIADFKYLNKVCCTIEDFFALSLAINDDIKVALDDVLANKLLLFILRHNMRHLNNLLSIEFITNTLINVFGESTLKSTLKLIDVIDFEDMTC